jgi:asparagine synthase (glutamine-hydrolysing)
MAGIAGITGSGKQGQVEQMLDKMSHRGPAGHDLIEGRDCTLGLVWTRSQANAATMLKQACLARDEGGHERLAQAQATSGGFLLKRDRLGVAPLYYGWVEDGILCFASEVKALLEVTRDVYELPPGCCYDGRRLKPYFRLNGQPPLDEAPGQIALELRQRLSTSIKRRIGDRTMGAWLSGGLDSSTVAALVRPYVSKLHTFAAGTAGAPDLEHARAVADFIQAQHHEVIVTLDDMLAALPEVIYHLESFDALLVRSSITNYLAAKAAADYVPAIFSGEGGDELFAGYAYLKSLDPAQLSGELIDITGRLHNTALQRVDRCASAHGTMAHVAFLDPDVVDYALRIPVKYKLHGDVEKWILRQAMDGALPEPILNRTKAKFWLGAGVGDLLADFANQHVSDHEFDQERMLPGGLVLNSKEELMYYRIFREHFGDFDNLAWMGRTKGAPVQQ